MRLYSDTVKILKLAGILNFRRLLMSTWHTIPVQLFTSILLQVLVVNVPAFYPRSKRISGSKDDNKSRFMKDRTTAWDGSLP